MLPAYFNITCHMLLENTNPGYRGKTWVTLPNTVFLRAPSFPRVPCLCARAGWLRLKAEARVLCLIREIPQTGRLIIQAAPD